MRHPSPATIIATIALVFSMSGASFAAGHYLITSTSQIKPSVVRQLQHGTAAKVITGPSGLQGPAGPQGSPGTQGAGSVGPAGLKGAEGPQGASGATGAPGTEGKEGPKGDTGAEGEPGPAGTAGATVLASGESESGVYGTRVEGTGSTWLVDSLQFPIALSAPIAEGRIIANERGEAVNPECPGPGKAAPGFLCIYEYEWGGTRPPNVTNPEGQGSSTGTRGVILFWPLRNSSAVNYGTWTLTAE